MALALVALMLVPDAPACSHPGSTLPYASHPTDGATDVPVDTTVVIATTALQPDAVVHLIDVASGAPVQIQKATAKGPLGVTDDVPQYLVLTPGLALQPSAAYRIEYESWSATFTTGPGKAAPKSPKPGVKALVLTAQSGSGFHYACYQNAEALLEVSVALAAPEDRMAWLVSVGGTGPDSTFRPFTTLVAGKEAWPVFLRDFYSHAPGGCLTVSVQRIVAGAHAESVVVCDVPPCTLKSAADAPADAFPLGCDLDPPPPDEGPPADDGPPDEGAPPVDTGASDAMSAPASPSGGCGAAPSGAGHGALVLLALFAIARRRPA